MIASVSIVDPLTIAGTELQPMCSVYRSERRRKCPLTVAITVPPAARARPPNKHRGR